MICFHFNFLHCVNYMMVFLTNYIGHPCLAILDKYNGSSSDSTESHGGSTSESSSGGDGYPAVESEQAVVMDDCEDGKIIKRR